MKMTILFVACFACFKLNAQLQTDMREQKDQKETYFSFNPLGLLEPQMAAGFGFGNRFSLRSEYFAELSYLSKNPLYNASVNSFRGLRFITQYRYHFLQKWKSPRLGSKGKIARLNPFVGLEFRLKRVEFSDRANFINPTTNDTLPNYLYAAKATSLGGAIVFGHSYEVSQNGKWKIELSAGIGVKQKLVHFDRPSPGYKVVELRRFGLAPPDSYESVSSPYFPFTIRLLFIMK